MMSKSVLIKFAVSLTVYAVSVVIIIGIVLYEIYKQTRECYVFLKTKITEKQHSLFFIIVKNNKSDILDIVLL